jgi:ribosome-binding protein aMBF1 (putative translation factor)
MKITCNHSSSSYGVPVILSDDGDVMDYAPGIKAVRAKLSLSTQDLAEKCNVSRRTVEGWEQGRMPDAAALNVMAQLLAS